MECPSDKLLEQYSRGLLSGDAMAKLRPHVEGCPSCKRRLAHLKPVADTQRSPATGVSTFAGSKAARPRNSAQFKRGDTIGRYVIDAEIGIGGMGVVYLAYDPALDRRVALKLMLPDAVIGHGATEGRSRLLREAHAMAKLNHPNVVAIHDVGEIGDQVFFAMNLVEGLSLREWLGEKPRSWREILKVFLQAGRGLEAAHAVGLIHRDFKPDNVLLDGEGRVQVTDFGLARASTAEASPGEAVGPLEPIVPASGPASRSGLLSQPLTLGVSGTPGYMSPEQTLGMPFDARTDQYSFCVSLSEALFGPKPENSEWAPARDPALAAAVPAWVRQAVNRGMADNPKNRFPSMGELLTALGNDPAVRRRRALTAAGTAGLAMIAVGLGLYIMRHRASDLCYDPARNLAGIWNDETRTLLRRAFAATGAIDQADTAERVVKGLDRVAARWVDGYKGACQATRDTHQQSEAALSLRIECLDRQLYDLKGAIDLLSHPDGALLSSAVAVAVSLPPVAECANAFSLSLVEPPAPEIADKVRSIRLRIARGRALVAAQRMPEAVAALEPLTREAQEVGYGPASAEAFFMLARAQLNAAAHKLAAENFQQALDFAEASRLDELAARAAALLAGEIALNGGTPSEVNSALNRAKILTQRVGKGGLAELELEVALERVAAMRGVTADEVTHGQRALNLTKELLGPADPKLLTAIGNFASDLIDDARYAEAADAYQQAINLSEQLFGAKASGSKKLWAGYADLLAGLGRTEDALTAADHALQAKGNGPDDVSSIQALAIEAFALARKHKLEEARTALHRATEIGDQLKLSTTVEFDEVNLFIAETAVLVGEPKLAVQAYERNLIADKEMDPSNAGWVGNDRVGGEAYLLAAQPEKARDLLQKGLLLASGHVFYPRWIPDVRFRLAQALLATGGDRQQITELDHAAKEDLLKLPEEKALLDELDAWTASALDTKAH